MLCHTYNIKEIKKKYNYYNMWLFDFSRLTGFLKSRPSSQHKCFQTLMKTQVGFFLLYVSIKYNGIMERMLLVIISVYTTQTVVSVLLSQMFSHFIEQRSFVTSQDSLLAFFDDCLEKVSVAWCIVAHNPLSLYLFIPRD